MGARIRARKPRRGKGWRDLRVALASLVGFGLALAAGAGIGATLDRLAELLP